MDTSSRPAPPVPPAEGTAWVQPPHLPCRGSPGTTDHGNRQLAPLPPCVPLPGHPAPWAALAAPQNCALRSNATAPELLVLPPEPAGALQLGKGSLLRKSISISFFFSYRGHVWEGDAVIKAARAAGGGAGLRRGGMETELWELAAEARPRPGGQDLSLSDRICPYGRDLAEFCSSGPVAPPEKWGHATALPQERSGVRCIVGCAMARALLCVPTATTGFFGPVGWTEMPPASAVRGAENGQTRSCWPGPCSVPRLPFLLHCAHAEQASVPPGLRQNKSQPALRFGLEWWRAPRQPAGDNP